MRLSFRSACIFFVAVAAWGVLGGHASRADAQDRIAPRPTEIWYGTRRVTPAPPSEPPMAESNSAFTPPIILDALPATSPPRPPETKAPPLGAENHAPLVDIILEPTPLQWTAAPLENPLRDAAVGLENPGRQGNATGEPPGAIAPSEGPPNNDVLPGPDPKRAATLSLLPPIHHEGEATGRGDVSQASLWRGLPSREHVGAALPRAAAREGEAVDPGEPENGGAEPSSPHEPQHAPQSTGARPASSPDGREESSWGEIAAAAAMFLTGMLVCPLIVALALVRWVRRSAGPLFRIEIVNPYPGESAAVWSPRASFAHAPPTGEPRMDDETSGAAPTALRRGAVSLEPPPLELPVEETFEARRRREQEQQSQHEQEILKQLFEDNLELRRQMGEDFENYEA